LPALNDELRGGKNNEILIELAAQLSADTVCGVALTSTTGLAQRAGIANLRRSLQVPVGDQLLVWVFNALARPPTGDTIKAAEWILRGADVFQRARSCLIG
jgi:F0F1-type ATP synthase beta subunit